MEQQAPAHNAKEQQGAPCKHKEALQVAEMQSGRHLGPALSLLAG